MTRGVKFSSSTSDCASRRLQQVGALGAGEVERDAALRVVRAVEDRAPLPPVVLGVRPGARVAHEVGAGHRLDLDDVGAEHRRACASRPGRPTTRWCRRRARRRGAARRRRAGARPGPASARAGAGPSRPRRCARRARARGRRAAAPARRSGTGTRGCTNRPLGILDEHAAFDEVVEAGDGRAVRRPARSGSAGAWPARAARRSCAVSVYAWIISHASCRRFERPMAMARSRSSSRSARPTSTRKSAHCCALFVVNAT